MFVLQNGAFRKAEMAVENRIVRVRFNRGKNSVVLRQSCLVSGLKVSLGMVYQGHFTSCHISSY